METGDMDFNSHVAMWSAIVGFLMPLLISFVNQPRWSSFVRGLVAFVASAIAAAGTVYFTGDFDEGSDVVTAALTVFLVTINTYHFWWKPSMIAPKIERLTSVGTSEG